MTQLNKKIGEDIKKAFLQSQYTKREWTTDDSCTMTLAEYAEYINPDFKHISDNPVIIAKERKDTKDSKEPKYFYKMWIPLSGESGVEYELSYENDFEEGDVIDKDSLTFCIETFLDKKHGYATGNII